MHRFSRGAVSDLQHLVAAERDALVADLAGLTGGQWNSPTLCSGWTVRDVVAHLSAIASLTQVTLAIGLTRARFDFDTFAGRSLQRHRVPDTAATLSEFRNARNQAKRPWLGELVVHGADIRGPLQIPHLYAPGALMTVADFYKHYNLLIGAKNRIAGLALQATDEEWSHGHGPLVAGPLLSIVLAMTGRRAGCQNLNGPGVDVLERRCS
jgi:uncharacterized protein (TIGR03083 family)